MQIKTSTNIWAAAVLIFILVLSVLIFAKPAEEADTFSADEKYLRMEKSGLTINVSTVASGIHSLASDPQNGLALKVQVNDSAGAAVGGAYVKLESGWEGRTFVSGSFRQSGSFKPEKGVTGDDGCFISVYYPPAPTHAEPESNIMQDHAASGNADPDTSAIKITARLSYTDKNSSMAIDLIPVPVVLIHGYQASAGIFSGLSQYLKEQGFDPASIDYRSEDGVVEAAAELSAYLDAQKAELLADGVQVKRFDLITHSMGGLAARYYTCSNEYASRGDVRKLIFISVPQKGSLFASLGLQYIQDKSVFDMATESELFLTIFPSMLNSGLNPSIETGSILGRYDEVVSAQNASLAGWNIETELFDVGESSFTVDKLMNGAILDAANHKLVLYNRKVYRRIVEMLETQLAYPAAK